MITASSKYDATDGAKIACVSFFNGASQLEVDASYNTKPNLYSGEVIRFDKY